MHASHLVGQAVPDEPSEVHWKRTLVACSSEDPHAALWHGTRELALDVRHSLTYGFFLRIGALARRYGTQRCRSLRQSRLTIHSDPLHTESGAVRSINSAHPEILLYSATRAHLILTSRPLDFRSSRHESAEIPCCQTTQIE